MYIGEQYGRNHFIQPVAIVNLFSLEQIKKFPTELANPNYTRFVENRHNGGRVSNYLFLDGSIKTLRLDELLVDRKLLDTNGWFWRGRRYP